MAANRIQPHDGDIAAHLAAVEPERRRVDAQWLDAVFRDVTGYEPVLWGDTMIGYGAYDYTYASGRSGSFLATGFAPRKANMVLYILPGYTDFSEILGDLGPHRKGKSCLYLGAMAKLDEAALRRLIRAGLDDLATHWPVRAS